MNVQQNLRRFCRIFTDLYRTFRFCTDSENDITDFTDSVLVIMDESYRLEKNEHAEYICNEDKYRINYRDPPTSEGKGILNDPGDVRGNKYE